MEKFTQDSSGKEDIFHCNVDIGAFVGNFYQIPIPGHDASVDISVQDITAQEVITAINSQKNNKSPGLDGGEMSSPGTGGTKSKSK